MKTTEPIRDKDQVNQLLTYYYNRGEMRNHLLVNLCLHTALRISDILKLTTDDVYDFQNRCVRKCISVIEKKTGKSKIIALHKNVRTILSACFMSAKPSLPLIRNKRTNKAISRVQAHRLIRAAADSLGISQNISCHSLRKTFGYHAWKSGVSPVVIMEIYNHSSLTVTQRYLGVTQDDKNAVYLALNFVE